MYEIIERSRIVFGEEISTWIREITSCNVIEVEAGTNGFKGGDAGHGSRTYIRIQDLAGTAINVTRMLTDGCVAGVELELAGDCELGTMIEALEFALHVLKDQSGREA